MIQATQAATCEAGAGRQRIDDEIRPSGVASGCPELQDFDQPDHRDRDHGGLQAALRIGQTEGEPDQHEGKRVLAVLPKIGMRPQARRSQRRESHSGGQIARRML